MSSASRLPLVVPGDGGSLRRDLPEALDLLLSGLDVPRDLIDREMTATGDIVFAATNDASVVASLNDLASRLRRYLPEWALTDPTEISLRLGSAPLKALGFELPADATRKLLA